MLSKYNLNKDILKVAAEQAQQLCEGIPTNNPIVNPNNLAGYFVINTLINYCDYIRDELVSGNPHWVGIKQEILDIIGDNK